MTLVAVVVVLETVVVADWVVVDTAPVVPLVGAVAVLVSPAALAATGQANMASTTTRK